jgi:signal transduction histidine kinase
VRTPTQTLRRRAAPRAEPSKECDETSDDRSWIERCCDGRVPDAVIPRHPACTGLLDVVDSVSAAILALADDGTIVFANERASGLFARRAAPEDAAPELVGTDVARWLAPLPALLEAQARDERPTMRFEGPAGVQVLGFSITRARRSGPALHVISFQDLTRVRTLEEERDRLLRLATVGEVMPMLLHETKNPLAAACTLLELLIEERTEPALQSDLHNVLVEIRRSLLTLEGLGSVGRELRASTPQAIDHAVTEAVGLIEARARQQGIVLSAHIEAMPLLPLDASSLRGIVLNLLTNAIHACGAAGHVAVKMRLVEGTLELDVEDDGAGMSADVLARCCETFFTTKRSGSGLGLALCARLVDEARGTLSIESAPGNGTRVHIAIPPLVNRPRPHSVGMEIAEGVSRTDAAGAGEAVFSRD